MFDVLDLLGRAVSVVVSYTLLFLGAPFLLAAVVAVVVSGRRKVAAAAEEPVEQPLRRAA